MLCPNCGASDIEYDSNFCPSCGAQISNNQTSKSASPSRTSQTLIQQPIRQQPTPSVSLYRTKPTIIGPYSKRALGFSIACLCFLVAGLIMGGGTIYLISNAARRNPSSYYYSPYYLTPAMGFAGLIPAIALNGVGLIFAIIARVYASKARSEMVNASRKIGGVFSILGIVFNSIALAAGLIIGPLILINALRLFGFYPHPYYG
ncbi:MAG: TFIIB-type zinc ribbon-containing protein [Promethearchaeota archaeon]